MGLSSFLQEEPLGPPTTALAIDFSRDTADGKALQLKTGISRTTFLHVFWFLNLWDFSFSLPFIKPYTFSSRSLCNVLL